MTCIQEKEKEKLREKVKYNKANLEIIKTAAGELLQIGELDTSMAIADRCIYEYSYEEKGRWEEVKALIMFYNESKKAELEGKKWYLIKILLI